MSKGEPLQTRPIKKTWSGGTPPISPDYSVDSLKPLASRHFAVLHVLLMTVFSQTN